MPEHEFGKVTISEEEYEELLRAKDFLARLIGRVVDNWDGYGDAVEMMEDFE